MTELPDGERAALLARIADLQDRLDGATRADRINRAGVLRKAADDWEEFRRAADLLGPEEESMASHFLRRRAELIEAGEEV